MHRIRLTLLLTLTLSTPASALGNLNPGNLGQLGQVWQFIQQIQSWLQSLQDLEQLKNDIFGDVNYEDLAQQLLGRAADQGLQLAGIDVGALLGQGAAFQNAINDFRAQLVSQAKGVVNLAFLDPAEKASGMTGSLALNPNLAQNRFEAAQTIARTTEDTAQNVQDLADGAKLVQDSQDTVDETKARADQAAQNAAALTQSALEVQSTREGVQLLVRAQAEAIISSAYNATAFTTALSQQVRQSQVTNKQLSELVNGMLQERASNARQALEEVRARQAEAKAMGEQAQSTIDTAAGAVSRSFEVDPNAIDPDKLFP